MRITSFIAVTLVLSLALVAWSAGASDAKEGKDQKDAKESAAGIDGSWLPSAAEMAGKKYPDEVRKTIKLVIKGDTYKTTVGQAVDEGTLKINPTPKPHEIDITGSEGPNKGKTILAIYETDGPDTLRICYDLSGKSRPTEFKTAEGTKLFLVTYQREKP